MEFTLPAIPAKRYFTIGEVGQLCGVKPHVLRYWEQEFSQLRPMKRRGNRRYYQHHEVLMIRRIRELLYEQGFTISGARNKLQELAIGVVEAQVDGRSEQSSSSEVKATTDPLGVELNVDTRTAWSGETIGVSQDLAAWQQFHKALLEIRLLLV